jgi:hypothetical protein
LNRQISNIEPCLEPEPNLLLQKLPTTNESFHPRPSQLNGSNMSFGNVLSMVKSLSPGGSGEKLLCWIFFAEEIDYRL